LKKKGFDTFIYVDGTKDYKLNEHFSSGYIIEKGDVQIKAEALFFSVPSKEFLKSDIFEEVAVMMAIQKVKKLGLQKFVIFVDSPEMLKKVKTPQNKNVYKSLLYRWIANETKEMEVKYIKAKRHQGIELNEKINELVKKVNSNKKQTLYELEEYFNL
jgi:ribonuclease HI